MEVEFDLRKTLAENAADYYRKSKKAKSKIAGAKKSLQETRTRIKKVEQDGLEGGGGDSPTASAPTKKKKGEWFHKFRWFTSSDGFLVVGGRDATSNEVLIKKHTEAGDVVFHAHLQGAPFFVVKNPGNTSVPETTLFEAAGASASYSSGFKQGLGSCDVYQVEPSQLSKTAESGEYLAKGAFVVRGQREWYRDTPLKVAVGFDAENSEIVGGPESAVSAKTAYYVIVKPGSLKSSQLAKEVKKAMLRKTSREAGLLLKKTSLDDIQRVLPAGGGQISS